MHTGLYLQVSQKCMMPSKCEDYGPNRNSMSEPLVEILMNNGAAL